MRTPPASAVSYRGVQACQRAFSCTPPEPHLLGLAGCEQPLVEVLDALVVTRGDQRRGGGTLETTGGFENYQGTAQIFEPPEELLVEPILVFSRSARGISRREDGHFQIADAGSVTLARATVRAQPEVLTSAAVMAVMIVPRALPQRSLRVRCRCAPKPRYKSFLEIWEGSPGRIKLLEVSPLRAGGKRKSMPTYVCSLNWTEVGIRNVGDTLDRVKAS